MAVVLVVAAAVLLVTAAALGPDQQSVWLRLVYIVSLWAGPLLIILIAGVLARRRLAHLLRSGLVDLAGPAIVRAMPPRAVLGALLPWIYGSAAGHQAVLTGILGGAGRDPAGRDTAVSRNTSAHFRLRAIDDTTCASEATWTHEFSGIRYNHKFVVFATFDPEIAFQITNERIFPLFELWLLEDDEKLEEFVPNLRETFEIGITYTEMGGVVHSVSPRELWGEEVALGDYDQFVRLPVGIDRKNLRIVQFDLWDLADPDHVVEAVESLSIRATSFNTIDIGFISWSTPHPCFVRTVTFDVSELAPEGQKLVYLAIPFTMKETAIAITGQWVEAPDRIELPLDSWMLPGHGVTLLWRPIDQAESRRASQDR